MLQYVLVFFIVIYTSNILITQIVSVNLLSVDTQNSMQIYVSLLELSNAITMIGYISSCLPHPK